ncbi:unnamed protein product [Dibothriocephalus latus]|uniref:Uncharacterized protein n=1 Tax=Dibothriocephalus latus TaxID=60516 RepID=A0A3P7LH88_DIBLA|nr:unnamed protein product [Dibothriocephalus latus]
MRSGCVVRVLQLTEDCSRLADQYKSFLTPESFVGSAAFLRRVSAGGHEFSDSYHADICMASSCATQLDRGSSLPPPNIRARAAKSGRPIRSLSRSSDMLAIEEASQEPSSSAMEEPSIIETCAASVAKVVSSEDNGELSNSVAAEKTTSGISRKLIKVHRHRKTLKPGQDRKTMNSLVKKRKQKEARTAAVRPCTSALCVRERRRRDASARRRRPQKSSWSTRFSLVHGGRHDAKVSRSGACMQTLHKPSQTEATPPVTALQLVSTGQQTGSSALAATLASWCMELLSRGIISLPPRGTRRPLLSLPAAEILSDLDCSDPRTYIHEDDPLCVDVDHVVIEEVTDTVEDYVNPSVCQEKVLSEPIRDLEVIPSSSLPDPINRCETVSVCFEEPSTNAAHTGASGIVDNESDRLSWPLGDVSPTESYSVSQEALDAGILSPPEDLSSTSDIFMAKPNPGIQANLKLQRLAEGLLEEVQNLLPVEGEGSGASERVKCADLESLEQCFKEFQSSAAELRDLTKSFSDPNDEGRKKTAAQSMRLVQLDLSLLRCAEEIGHWLHLLDFSTAHSPNNLSSKSIQLFRIIVLLGNYGFFSQIIPPSILLLILTCKFPHLSHISSLLAVPPSQLRVIHNIALPNPVDITNESEGSATKQTIILF